MKMGMLQAHGQIGPCTHLDFHVGQILGGSESDLKQLAVRCCTQACDGLTKK